MATNQLTKSFKLCATCALWEGDRTTSPGRHSKFDTLTKGNCAQYRIPKLAMSSTNCKYWEVWPVIK